MCWYAVCVLYYAVYVVLYGSVCSLSLLVLCMCPLSLLIWFPHFSLPLAPSSTLTATATPIIAAIAPPPSPSSALAPLHVHGKQEVLQRDLRARGKSSGEQWAGGTR